MHRYGFFYSKAFLRLLTSSEKLYLSVRGKNYMVSDQLCSSIGTLDTLCAEALSEAGLRKQVLDESKVCNAYHITLVEMAEQFEQRLLQAYQDDSQ